MAGHRTPAATERLRAALRCPACGASVVAEAAALASAPTWRPWSDAGALRCERGHTFAVLGGVPDFLGDAHAGRITPFQRVMQFPPVVAVYERWWRPLGFWVASRWDVAEAVAEVVRLCEPARRALVVDLGCGPGNYTRALWHGGAATVVGVDLSPVMLARAASSGGEGLCFVRASAMDLPFADASVDAVCCAGALHLFDDPDRAMREIARVLVRGGVLVGQTVVRPAGGAARAAAAILDRYVRFGFFDGAADLEARLRAAGLTPSAGRTQGIAHLFRAEVPA
ncbi:MAG TPA: methyltransferase domain-containing protein [Myxococcota bacterium]|jgi:SAM-dependent methyltransferase|nr:methyltransferase domain-containing protein [Myxococcota bacterium]